MIKLNCSLSPHCNAWRNNLNLSSTRKEIGNERTGKRRCVNDFQRNGAKVISDEFLKERRRRTKTGKDIERGKDSSVTAWLSFKKIDPQKQAQK